MRIKKKYRVISYDHNYNNTGVIRVFELQVKQLFFWQTIYDTSNYTNLILKYREFKQLDNNEY